MLDLRISLLCVVGSHGNQPSAVFEASELLHSDLLGDRLEREGEGRHRDNASLCYICSGNVEKFVECW